MLKVTQLATKAVGLQNAHALHFVLLPRISTSPTSNKVTANPTDRQRWWEIGRMCLSLGPVSPQSELGGRIQLGTTESLFQAQLPSPGTVASLSSPALFLTLETNI